MLSLVGILGNGFGVDVGVGVGFGVGLEVVFGVDLGVDLGLDFGVGFDAALPLRRFHGMSIVSSLSPLTPSDISVKIDISCRRKRSKNPRKSSIGSLNTGRLLRLLAGREI